jgi:hypothetical protein
MLEIPPTAATIMLYNATGINGSMTPSRLRNSHYTSPYPGTRNNPGAASMTNSMMMIGAGVENMLPGIPHQRPQQQLSATLSKKTQQTIHQTCCRCTFGGTKS